MRTAIVMAMMAFGVSAAEVARPLKPAEGGVGRLVPNTSFTDLNGTASTLADFKSDKFLVVALTNDTCPLCRKYAPTLAKLETEFAAKGVSFLFVNPTDATAKSPFQGRYVLDRDGKLATALGAASTTDVFVLDAARTIRYRGAIDDQYGIGYATDAPKHEFLRHALTKLLDGKEPEVSATTAPGCDLDLAKPTTTVGVTYHNRISRIVQQNCLECHRDGGVGPFPLASYDDVVRQRGAIRKVLTDGTMPPWFAGPVKEGTHSPFKNDRSLSAADKADLLAWLASDRPMGEATDAPTPREFKSSWSIGKPDAVFQLPKPVAVKATGIMPYQMISVETNFDEDKWVQAVEIQPTAREVVHHALVHVLPKGNPLARLPGGGFRIRVDDERQGYFAAYVPGNAYTILPDGQARLLPKGATLRFQMHYTPNGKATSDQTRLGITFAKGPPSTEAKVASVASTRISIPPQAENHKEVAKLRTPADVTLVSLMPHMHLRAHACRYELTTPDGVTTTLLDVPHYDFNWQLRYQLAEPLAVKKGSTFTFTVWYDNSSNNPANPDPTKRVKWGPQTSDEMHLGYLEYVVDRKSKTELVESETEVKIPAGGMPIPERFQKALGVYDKNSDGKLNEAEIDAMPTRLKQVVLASLRRNR